MATSEKTTIYLDPKVKKGVQYYALRDDRSLSEIINEKLMDFLEDMVDLADVEAHKDEPLLSFEEVVKDLGLNIDDVRREAAKERGKKTSK
jgi:hypothetical protein